MDNLYVPRDYISHPENYSPELQRLYNQRMLDRLQRAKEATARKRQEELEARVAELEERLKSQPEQRPAIADNSHTGPIEFGDLRTVYEYPSSASLLMHPDGRHFKLIPDGATQTPGAVGGNSQDESKVQPWEQIPDHAWDRTAVELLYRGLSDSEIARAVGVDAKTVTNRLSALRGQFPETVLTREQLKRQLKQ